MKILSRYAFLLQPEGIFFCKGVQWVLDGFCIKGETIFDRDGEGIDFFYTNLVDIESFNSDEHFERLDDSLNHGTSWSINQSEGRDGSFDDEEIFMIFETEDLLIIRKLIDEALSITLRTK